MRKKFYVIPLILVMLMINACSSSQQSLDQAVPTAPDYPSEPARDSNEMTEYPTTDSDQPSDDKASVEPDKMIVQVWLSFQTATFDESIQELKQQIAQFGGVVENSLINTDAYQREYAYRNARYTVRVPKDKGEAFQTAISEKIGTLSSEQTQKSDATKSYRDNEARLEVLEQKEARLLALMERAEKIEDIIAIEQSLSETIAEKEVMKRNLQSIDDQVAYSTYTIQINEVLSEKATQKVDQGFGARVKSAFQNTWGDFLEGIQNLVIVFIYFLPALLFLMVIGLLLFAAWKKWGNRTKRREVEKPKGEKDDASR